MILDNPAQITLLEQQLLILGILLLVLVVVALAGEVDDLKRRVNTLTHPTEREELDERGI